MRLQSNFALLDVKRGRVGLNRHFKSDTAEPIPVTIHGAISGIFYHDDGESQEFTVDVTRVDTVDTASAIGLLKELSNTIGSGGLGTGMGWNNCNHCFGWPKHKSGCIIIKVDAFLKGK